MLYGQVDTCWCGREVDDLQTEAPPPEVLPIRRPDLSMFTPGILAFPCKHSVQVVVTADPPHEIWRVYFIRPDDHWSCLDCPAHLPGRTDLGGPDAHNRSRL